MVLVAHSEYAQSVKGLKDANVITIIDHHGDGSVTTGNQLIYDARPLGSTATIIWLRYRSYGVAIDRSAAYAMVSSILSDTKNLLSDATTFTDREALKELSLLAGIKDIGALYKEMFQASLSYEARLTRRFSSMITRNMKAAGKSMRLDSSMRMMRMAREIWLNEWKDYSRDSDINWAGYVIRAN